MCLESAIFILSYMCNVCYSLVLSLSCFHLIPYPRCFIFWKPQCTLDAAKFALEARGSPLPVIERTKRKHSESERTKRKRSESERFKRKQSESGERDRKRGKEIKMSSGQDEQKTKQAVEENRALLVHRLPLGTTEEQLLRVMENRTRVVAVKAQPIEFKDTKGKSLVSVGVINVACLVCF